MHTDPIIHKKNRLEKNRLALAVSVALTASGAMVSMPTALAQERNEEAIEEVVVTGFRQSIRNAIDTKRSATSIVEAVSAEDIGKLPDFSIAESIARLPGLAAQRLDGRASSLSIRGLGENFSATTFNGREQVSIGDNRGVEFDLYPSEIMSGVTVYKTPDATLTSQGIAGVVDLQTTRPLSQRESTVSINGFLEQSDIGKLNPDGEDLGHRATFSYIDQFNGDTIGVALAVATIESPNNEERWDAWGYPTTADGDNVLGGAKPFVRSSLLQRDTVLGVIEFQPSDNLRIIADALYIDFLDEKILRGIEIPGAWDGSDKASYEVVSVSNGFVTEGIFKGNQSQVRNDFEQRDAELTAFGFNLEYDINESTVIEFDAGSSKVDRTVWSLESYSGTGRGVNNGATDDIRFNQINQEGTTFTPTLDYSDYNLIQLGGALDWGNGSTVPKDGQDGFINIPEIEDELTTLELALTKSFEDGVINQVEGGLYYSDRSKTKMDTGIFLTLPAYPDRLPVPEAYRLGTTSLEFIGMGNMIAYDSFRFWQDGNYNQKLEDLTEVNRSVNDWTVNEEITIGYVKADFETQFGGMPVFGNFGLQVVQTDQSSDGKAVEIVNGLVEVIDASDGDSYTEFLPSINVIFQLTEEQQVRLAASRTMSRSRMDRMNAGFSYDFDDTRNVPGEAPFTANGGNPRLRPNIANQFDVSYEYYFSDDGYISAALYYKDLRNWQIQEDIPFDIADLVNPASLPSTVQSTLGQANVWVSSEGGEVNGLELTASIPGHILADALDGFGAILSASIIDSSLETPSGDEIEVPGLSDRIYNMTFYYEKGGFQARASLRKRSDFRGERFGISFTREDTTVVGAELWDAQISYDFSQSGVDGLTVTLQAQNIADEPFTTLNSDGFVKDHQIFGRTFLLGASYKF